MTNEEKELAEIREKITRIWCCFAHDDDESGRLKSKSCTECPQAQSENLKFPNCFWDICDNTQATLNLFTGYIKREPLVLKGLSDEEIMRLTGITSFIKNDGMIDNTRRLLLKRLKAISDYTLVACQKQVDEWRKGE